MSAGHDDPFGHVKDSSVFEFPEFVSEFFGSHVLKLPLIENVPIIGSFQITKFMVLQVVAALLTIVIFRGLASRVRGGKPVSGAWWNFWEAVALFVRDEVVRPSIGYPHQHDHGAGHGHDNHGHAADHGHAHAVVSTDHGGAAALHVAPATKTQVEVGHPADRYLPFIWSVFFYILFCNLLGAFPFLGSATADTAVTGALALMAFLYVVKCGSEQSGFVGFWKSLVPHMDLPGPIAFFLIPMLWTIEVVGLLIKHCVLAVRLFANMLGGHTVISVFLLFIAQSADHGSVWWLVTPASTIGQLSIGLLELFVAFLQAYVFSLLTSLFISMAVNPH